MHKLIQASIMAAIGILVFASLLIPVVNDGASPTKTLDNRADCLFNVEKLDENSDYTFYWSYEEPTKITVNDVKVSLSSATVVCAVDTFLLRFGQDNASGYYLQSVGGNLGLFVSERGDNAGNMTITANAGTITATIVKVDETTTTKTIDYTEGYGISSTGAYVMKSPTQSAYMLEDSPIVAMGLTNIANVWNNLFQITGTINDITVTQKFPNPATYTISDEQVNYNDVAGFEGLYSLDSVTFKATNIADPTITKDCLYNFFIVPATVTAEKSVHADEPTRDILAVLPLILICALIMGVVGYAVYSRIE